MRACVRECVYVCARARACVCVSVCLSVYLSVCVCVSVSLCELRYLHFRCTQGCVLHVYISIRVYSCIDTIFLFNFVSITVCASACICIGLRCPVYAQDGIVALGKAHTRSAPSFSNLPKICLQYTGSVRT